MESINFRKTNQMKTRNKIWKWSMLSALALLLSGTIISCSKDELTSAELIEKHHLIGNYIFQVTPTFEIGGKALAKGEVEGTITHEGNGVLRLKYDKFIADPMPFEMSVDLKMTISERGDLLLVKNVMGDNNFIASLVEGSGGIDPDDVPGGLEVPIEQLLNGIDSKGKSEVTGVIYLLENGKIEYALDLYPNIGLPLVIKIKSIEKL